jgi:hypothetical protein
LKPTRCIIMMQAISHCQWHGASGTCTAEWCVVCQHPPASPVLLHAPSPRQRSSGLVSCCRCCCCCQCRQ